MLRQLLVSGASSICDVVIHAVTMRCRAIDTDLLRQARLISGIPCSVEVFDRRRCLGGAGLCADRGCIERRRPLRFCHRKPYDVWNLKPVER
jgi:hypothetical protein